MEDIIHGLYIGVIFHSGQVFLPYILEDGEV